MNGYFTARIPLWQLLSATRKGEVSGLRIAKTRHGMVFVTDGRNHVWLMPPCVYDNGCSLQVWAGNDESGILGVMEMHIQRPFVSENELGIMHLG